MIVGAAGHVLGGRAGGAAAPPNGAIIEAPVVETPVERKADRG
jgi:hypothetical protein